MEYVILAVSLLSLAVSLAVLIKVSKTSSGKGISEEDVRRACSNSVSELGGLLGSNIEKTNKEYLAKTEENLKRLNEQMATFKAETSALTEKENLKNIANINDKFDTFSKNMGEKFALISQTVENNLSTLRRENTDKLGEIQKTVDENLQKTLEGRLKDTFDSVITQMGKVNTAMGEIKGLASDVGSLKNVLTNVKTKGIVGEVILGNIIRETLTKDQYEENIATKKNSREVVEFAVKMPAGEKGEFVYLPIDSKFPLEAYHDLKNCTDSGDKEGAEKARKELRSRLKTFAKDIKTKYVDVPYTTDFAIMFLPIEGLYIEAIDSGLFEEVQREYKINIAGPSTLTALLNALQMGFKSLAIQKRSNEVFELLRNVEKEFENFADVLAKTQKKIADAGSELDNLVGARTKKIQQQFKKLGELPNEASEPDGNY